KPQEPVRHVVRLRAEQGRDVLERRMDDLEMSDLLGSGEDIDEIARRPLFFEERESDFLRFIGRRSLRRDEDERMKALFFAAIYNGAIALFENPFFEPIAYYLEPRPSRFAFEEIVIERRTEDFVDLAERFERHVPALPPDLHKFCIGSRVNRAVERVYFFLCFLRFLVRARTVRIRIAYFLRRGVP